MHLLVIGFTGADHTVYRDLYPKGMSNFRDCDLRSECALEGPGWATIYTGQNIKLHKITSMFGTKGPTSAGWRDVEKRSIQWRLRRLGLKVMVMNLPITQVGFPFNHEELEADLIHFFFSERIKEEFPTLARYVSSPQRTVGSISIRPESTVDVNLLLAVVEDHNSVMIDRMVRYNENMKEADFGFVQFSFIDRLGHILSMHKSIAELAYAEMLRVIKELQLRIGPEHLMTVSPHGFLYNMKNHHGCRNTLCLRTPSLLKVCEKPKNGTKGIAEFIMRVMGAKLTEEKIAMLGG